MRTAIGITAFIVGVATGACITRAPRLDYNVPQRVINEPTCATPLAVLPGKQVLLIVREGSTVALQVRYDGVVLGNLLTADIYTQTAWVSQRPPLGWKVGGR